MTRLSRLGGLMLMLVSQPSGLAQDLTAAQLGLVLLEARTRLYQSDSAEDYAELVAYGLDTRYSVFVRSWLYFEQSLLEQQLSRSAEHPQLSERWQTLLKLRQKIDLE